MRKIFTFSLVGFFLLSTATFLITACSQKKETTIKKKERKPGDNHYDGIDFAIEQEILQTKDPATGKVPWDRLRIAIEKTEQAKNLARANRTEATQALSWIERGPNGDFSRVNGNPRQNDDQTSGRIRAVMVDSLDPTHKTVFIGSVAGGLWKTTDITVAPANWTPVNDFLSNLAIADLCQDPRPGFQNIMYMATGESYFNADAVRGVGVFKSTDAGVTWNFLPSTSAFVNGTKILCDFQGNVYLGTRGSGLQRSIDGGTSWTNITPTGLSNDVCELEISSTAVAARLHVATGIFSASGYRFTDIPSTVTSGAGWTAATTPFTTFNQRTELAISGNFLYACPDNASHQVPTIWASTDGGANWTATAAQPGGGTWANGQGWYSLSAAINPTNSNELIVGGLDCYKTTNGGTSWAQISRWVGPSAFTYVHADQQDLQWYDGGSKMIFACDGGIHYSTNGGTIASDRNKGLRIKQFYSVAIHPTDVNNFIAGAQDNGMHRLNHVGLDSSIEFYGGDGMFCAIDQNEPQFQFGSAFNNNIRRSLNGGVSWGNVSFAGGRFVSPWDYDNVGNRMYLCSGNGNYIRWDNPQTGTTSATVTITDFGGLQVSAVHVSPYTANRVFFGTSNGTTSRLIRVDDAHTAAPTTTIITPAGSSGFLNCVVTGSSDQNLIACFSNFGVNNVWVTTDGGTTWTASDGNLPDMPVRWALFHPDGNTKAYIATATGVWETDLLNGASTVWAANASFPNVSTDMIKYRAMDRTIAAGTHGRGVWTSIIPAAGGFSFSSPAPVVAACPAPESMQATLMATFNSGFTNPITLSASAAPGATFVTFTNNPLTTGAPSTSVILNNTNTLASGSYVITITGTAIGAPTQTRDITFTITAGSGPAITVQPTNQTVCAGANTSFSITSASANTFQWQLSTDGGATYNNLSNGGVYSGATTATLNITGTTAGLNNNRYRCNASTQCGTTTSNPGILTVNTAPAVTSQPVNASACTGANASFTVGATGSSLAYQWYISTDGGANFNILNNGGVYTGATTATLTITGVTAGLNNNQYRCQISGICPTSPINSNPATLTVATALTITGQPADVIACAGTNASFTVTASGVGTYQWQISTDGGATYTNIAVGAPYSGINTATLTITGLTVPLSGNRYRCSLTSVGCGSAISTGALLTVNALPAITSNPTSATACTGTNQTFSVTATGTGIAYQWQLSTDGGATFNNIANGGVYSGATTASLTITGITIGLDNNRYRCVVTGTCTPAATSTPATLTVLAAVSITSNPINQTVCEGTNTSFSVGAVGTGYQWQVSTDGGITYNNIANGGVYSGATTPTLTLTSVIPSLNNYRYRAVVTNGSCTPGISTGALLTVNTLPIVSAQPQSVTICEGGNAGFTVTATTGVGALSYQWQVSTDGGTTYVNITGATTNAFAQTSIPLTQNGYRFRVIVTAGCGSITTTAAVLTVNALPVISFSLPATICLSDPLLTLSASPSGGTFSGPGVSGVLFNPIAASLGSRTVTYTATNAGCQAAVSRTILVNECSERHLRLGDFMAATVYPNPNNGNFNIRINTDLYTKIGLKVFNSMGQLVLAKNFSGVTYGSVLPVSLFNPANGVYHLYLYSDERPEFAKRRVSIIVKRP